MQMIAITGFSAELGGRRVLHDLTFTAGAGEFVAVCGPNGAGKTTLLRGLAGLLPGGRVDPCRVAYMEQGARSLWGLTVQEVAALGRIPWHDADNAAITRALLVCGVAKLAQRRVDQLSGGQARRAMLARALATETPVILLDEPVADLDPRAAHEVMALLASLASQGRCVIAVLHAVDLAAAYATRMVVLQDGRLLADGRPDEVLPAAAVCFGMTLGTEDSARLLRPTDGSTRTD